MQYVNCIRRYVGLPGVTLDEAVAKAVDECIEKGILSDFLRRNKAEAMSISIFEYNEEEEKEKLRKAEYQGGYEDGFADGPTDGITDGIKQGIATGIHALIADYLEDGLPVQRIIEKLQKIYGFTAEEAKSYFDNYTKSQNERC